jgi:hypothetical protein
LRIAEGYERASPASSHFGLTLPVAMLADRVGRKPVLYFVSVGSLLLAWPLWWLMHHPALS